MRRAVLVIFFTFAAASAYAQTYVAGAVGIDVSRFDRVDSRGAVDLSAGGEAMALTLRAGTTLGAQWGVEIGMTRPSEVEKVVDQGFLVPLAIGRSSPGVVLLPEAVVSSFQSSIRIARRNTTIDTVAWVSQPVGTRGTLVYLGGVSFNRVVERFEYEFPQRAGTTGLFVPEPTRLTTYGAGPLVGLDARLELTDHVMLVPGMRLHVVGGTGGRGWLLRSSVGLGWRF